MADTPSASVDTMQTALIPAATTRYLSLHTADTGTTGASEGTDGRQAIQFAASSGGTQASNTAQTWSSAAGGQTYNHFGIWTAATGGTFIRGGSLTSSITPSAGSQITVASGAITFTAS